MASSLAQPYATFLESPHSDTIECLEFIEEDRRIITGSRDGTLQVRDVNTRVLVGKPWIDTGSGAVHAMAISRNRMMVLTGSEDGRIRVWEVVTGFMTGKWNPGHTATISSICWSPDELHVASGSDDGMVIIWDARRGEILGEPIRTGHRHVYAVRYSSGGTTLVTSGCNNVIISWDVRKRQALRILEACPASQQVHCIALSSDCRRLFLGCSDRIVQTRTGAQETDIIGLGEHTGPISAIVLSHDDSWLATTSLDPTRHALCLWDLKTNQPVAQHLMHDNGLRCAAFARNGRLLATGGVDKKVYLWDISTLRGRIPSNYDHWAASTQFHSDVRDPSTHGSTSSLKREISPDATTHPRRRLFNDPLSSDAPRRPGRRRDNVGCLVSQSILTIHVQPDQLTSIPTRFF
ncbi:WD40 repeat-like protein [Rhizopogon vinicolor AM-OR11-026]|uniref:WD40 repeat-like protein n=1 Tax=Rhizopogon vinicolor AM-OR11-026 TaxID=1314800 RepID=A0A1B7MGQ2_9AGAM|nr:WD40 repeat-like protein [Rhizopogon vinicolor AM-OR11-026]